MTVIEMALAFGILTQCYKITVFARAICSIVQLIFWMLVKTFYVVNFQVIFPSAPLAFRLAGKVECPNARPLP